MGKLRIREGSDLPWVTQPVSARAENQHAGPWHLWQPACQGMLLPPESTRLEKESKTQERQNGPRPRKQRSRQRPGCMRAGLKVSSAPGREVQTGLWGRTPPPRPGGEAMPLQSCAQLWAGEAQYSRGSLCVFRLAPAYSFHKPRTLIYLILFSLT